LEINNSALRKQWQNIEWNSIPMKDLLLFFLYISSTIFWVRGGLYYLSLSI